MRKLLLAMFIGTSLYFTLPSMAIAAGGDKPRSPRPKIEQQMKRIRNAQNELKEQRVGLEGERRKLDQEWQKLKHHKGQMQPQRQWPARKQMHKSRCRPLCGLLMVMCLVVHILVAVWVYKDIRTRGTGSGIWIVIALISGLLGALVYAVVRLGDVKDQR
jgi:hypothetical protein